MDLYGNSNTKGKLENHICRIHTTTNPKATLCHNSDTESKNSYTIEKLNCENLFFTYYLTEKFNC